MQHRRLGRTDLEIAPLVFGASVIGWTLDEATAFGVLDAFVDQGFNAIDTADVYTVWAPCGGGTSERVIGDWLKRSGKRDRVVLATKVGSPMDPEHKGLSAKHIAASVEGSLRRLRTDRIDLYQAHVDDPHTPQAETAQAFDALVKAGKVRHIGASKLGADRIRSALAISDANGWARYATLQPLYNLYDRSGYETDYQPLALDQGLGAIPFYGLASGFLTGKYRSAADLAASAIRGNFVKDYLNPRGLRILAALDAVAGRHGATPAQTALAWEIAQPGVVAPIASATSVAQLLDIARCVALSLSAEDIAELDRASAAAG